MTQLSVEEIQAYIPHRYPFLFVDRVKEVDIHAEGGAIIRAIKNVTVNEDFFNGHFPKHPIMPGVLTLEAMTQAAGILGLSVMGADNAANIVYYFAGADNVRFKQPIVPGDQVILEAQYQGHKRGIWKFACRAIVDDVVVCSADITCAERDLEHT